MKNTCPICERTFEVTPWDDYFIPACGCYAHLEEGGLLCETCGIAHAWNCDKIPGRAERTAKTTEPNIVEVGGPMGTVHRGKGKR